MNKLPDLPMTPEQIEELVLAIIDSSHITITDEVWAEVSAMQDANHALHERLGVLERALIRVIGKGEVADTASESEQNKN